MFHLSGRRESNPLPSPWQGDVLPMNYARISHMIISGFIVNSNIVIYGLIDL